MRDGGGQTPFTEEATVGRGGATAGTGSLWLIQPTWTPEDREGGLTLTVVDGLWGDQVFGVVWLEGVGHLGGVEGQRDHLHVIFFILDVRSCKKQPPQKKVDLFQLSGDAPERTVMHSCPSLPRNCLCCSPSSSALIPTLLFSSKTTAFSSCTTPGAAGATARPSCWSLG